MLCDSCRCLRPHATAVSSAALLIVAILADLAILAILADLARLADLAVTSAATSPAAAQRKR